MSIEGLTSTTPWFDGSLAAVAEGLHLELIGTMATLGAGLLFLWLERRGRNRWAQVPSATFATSRVPYRESAHVTEHLRRAPLLVRTAAFGSLAFGLLFLPLILVALTSYPFDGIALPLIPGLALVVLDLTCAWLLLGRSPHAVPTARSGAAASLMANVGLLGLAAAHFVMVELQRREGIEHACSSSVTFVVIVFALASVGHALVLKAALRTHGHALAWQTSSTL